MRKWVRLLWGIKLQVIFQPWAGRLTRVKMEHGHSHLLMENITMNIGLLQKDNFRLSAGLNFS